MKATRIQLAAAIVDMLEKHSLDKVAKAMAAYLVKNKMTQQIDTLLHDIERESLRRGVLQVHVASARKLDKQQLEKIRELINSHIPSRAVHFNEKLQSELIGGVRLRALDTELDLSVKGKLERLRSEGVA